jgi:hypothetical protein
MSLVLLRGRLGIELLIAKKEGLCAKDENNICKKVLQFFVHLRIHLLV